MTDFFKSSKAKKILWLLGALIILLLVFRAGMVVGYRRASFFPLQPGDRRNFDEGRRGFWNDFVGRPRPGGHGISGSVIDVSSSTLSIKDGQNNEQSVLVSPGTIIRRGQETISISSIKSGDRITVIGEPNNGQIEARFIRIFDASSSWPGMFPRF